MAIKWKNSAPWKLVRGRTLEALEALEALDQRCSKGSSELAVHRQQNHFFIIT
jgi:hypothetical protein